MKTGSWIEAPRSENGSITILALLLLVILTLIGIGATTTTTTEIKIVRNEDVYRQNLGRSEAAGRMAGQTIQTQSTADLKTLSPSWLHASLPHSDIYNDTNWSTSNSSEVIDEANRYLALHAGVLSGASLDLSGTQVHSYVVYGYSTYGTSSAMRGISIIEMGFKRRY